MIKSYISSIPEIARSMPNSLLMRGGVHNKFGIAGDRYPWGDGTRSDMGQFDRPGSIGNKRIKKYI